MMKKTDFRLLRVRHYYTRRVLALNVGVKPDTVRSWENGARRPSLPVLSRMREYFPGADLLGMFYPEYAQTHN